MLAKEVWQGNSQKVEIIQTYAKGVKKGTENQQRIKETKQQAVGQNGPHAEYCRIYIKHI